jgi:hypothetical protein
MTNLRLKMLRNTTLYKGMDKMCFAKPKDPVKTNQRTQAVYSMPCGDCLKEHLGQSKCQFGTRLKEHQKAVSTSDKGKSTLAEHVCYTKYKIVWENSNSVQTTKRTSQSLHMIEEDRLFSQTFSKLIHSTKTIAMKARNVQKDPKLSHLLKTMTHCQLADRMRSLHMTHCIVEDNFGFDFTFGNK